jgi:hypothetical protein
MFTVAASPFARCDLSRHTTEWGIIRSTLCYRARPIGRRAVASGAMWKGPFMYRYGRPTMPGVRATGFALGLAALWSDGCMFDVKPRSFEMPSRVREVWSPDLPVQPDATEMAAAVSDGGTGTVTSAPAESTPRDEDAGPIVDAAPSDTSSSMDAATAADTSTELPDSSRVLCPRAELQARAESYFLAMSTGDATGLALHPSVRYTENGSEVRLGTGLWLSRPKPAFTRHVLDEQRCASLSEAVLTTVLGRIIFGVRLRYLDSSLLDIEAHVVPQNLAYYDPCPSGKRA